MEQHKNNIKKDNKEVKFNRISDIHILFDVDALSRTPVVMPHVRSKYN